MQGHGASGGAAVCALGHGMVGVLPFVCAPSMKCNLVSVPAMADPGISIQFVPGDAMHGHEDSDSGQFGSHYGSISQGANGLFTVSMVTRPSTPEGTSAPVFPPSFNTNQRHLICTAEAFELELASPSEVPDGHRGHALCSQRP